MAKPLEIDAFPRPQVILVIGVNGSGKTTTIAKLAHWLTEQDYGVMLVAGDTFRAAAIGQLRVWADRIGVPIISGAEGGDAASLVFEGVKQGTEKGIDVLIVDTAGRLQNKAGLMDELAKIRRVLGRLNPAAPHNVLLVLDATTGQNALSQIEIFGREAGVTGLVMTKLDGTARAAACWWRRRRSSACPSTPSASARGSTISAPSIPRNWAAPLRGCAREHTASPLPRHPDRARFRAAARLLHRQHGRPSSRRIRRCSSRRRPSWRRRRRAMIVSRLLGGGISEDADLLRRDGAGLRRAHPLAA